MIWPHYQNRYCLIYTNTGMLAPTSALSLTSVFIILSTIIFIINWFSFYLIIHHRMGKPFGEAFGLSYSYTNQSQMMMAIPMFKTTVHEKCFLTFKFLHNFFLGSIFLSAFSTQLISPQIKLLTDHEISLVKGFHPGPVTNFGIGEPCLNELKQGLYLRRGCFLTCDVANKTVQKHEGVVFLREEINFQQMFKVSKDSKHFDRIKKLVRRYFEAGMLDQIFNYIHATSYKFLEETGRGNQIKLGDMYETSYLHMLIGYCGSIITFFCELVFFRWKQRKQLRRNAIQPFQFVH
ncbi:uncharacterized protein LOC129569665 [Sitodiplosis mosellana]|uniref:uncharacterized protein LOC129569665 n=1 Tax=Sitodiplosis mosellana TaxID=263140 RepID=UPI002444F461|nr:uncharacterized protein LOC129569665 [Sitodiplosis mosellana]